MNTAIFRLSAFGDEVADDLTTQLEVLAGERLAWLELRGAWGKNVLDLTSEELARARALLDTCGFGVSAIGSPIGKSALTEPRANEEARLERAFHAAERLGTRLIRVFSFLVAPADAAAARDEVVERLGRLTARAAESGVTLVLENEKGVYGDNATRCHELLAAIAAPALRHAFDPANFVQVGVHPMRDAWPLLAPFVAHVHIKDARFSNGQIVPAGEGDGQVPELLEALARTGYQGFVTLEPHLQFAGPAGGYSGPDGMAVAVRALRNVITALTVPVTVE
jgi:sugar phosphate isomerase/epimerase